MAYTKTVWEDLPSTNTPINATNLNNIENGIKTNETNITALSNYSKNTYTSNGISIRLERYGRIVQCTFEGTTTSNLTTNTDYSVSIDSKYNSQELTRTCCIFNETGVIGYVWVDASQSKLYYRVKSNVSSPAFPRFCFTYISVE